MAHLLDGIRSPADVKQLMLPQLEQLAAEIREELITVLAKTGGHLGPNLGVVELTIAMHYVFNTPEDHFLFDVSHQAYVHKLLTGRRDGLHTIRTPSGLNGFMLRTESEHDCYGAGHAGTALSAALGMAVARDKPGGGEHVIAVAGDAAFTCGITYEALNNIAHHTKTDGDSERQRVVHRQECRSDCWVFKQESLPSPIRFPPRPRRKTSQEAGRIRALRMARRAEAAAKGMLCPASFSRSWG